MRGQAGDSLSQPVKQISIFQWRIYMATRRDKKNLEKIEENAAAIRSAARYLLVARSAYTRAWQVDN